jgi:hypothetical protein
MQVAAIMPCRGRAAQTVANVKRLLATAGYEDWRLILVSDGDDSAPVMSGTSRLILRERSGYWQALAYATQTVDAPLLVSLANDLWACDDWLRLAVEDYREHFGDGPGLLGFAGDGHGYNHSCHFLISRSLLDRYGGWPVWYRHNFGDAELCTRAQQDGLYAKSERAYLEHCHVERGLAPDDAVYQAGRATYRQDEALFVERRRLGWPLVSPS